MKVGRLYLQKFVTYRQAIDEVIDWLTFYNYRLLHVTLGYGSPIQFEKNWVAAHELEVT